MSRPLKKATDKNLMVLMVDSTDHVTGLAGLTLTITASKDGGAFASISPTVTDRGNGWYNIALTSSHTDTDGDLCLHVTGAGADPLDLRCVVNDQFGLETNSIDANAVATSGAAEIAAYAGMLNQGTAQGGAATSITLATSASSVDDFYNGAVVVIRNSTGVGQARLITDYVGSTRVATVAAWTTTPDATSDYVVIASKAHTPAEFVSTFWADSAGVQLALDTGNAATDAAAAAAYGTAIEADTQDIQSRIPAALVSGRMDASVGAMASGVVTATAIASGAITSAKIADNAITALTIADNAITALKINAGAITAAKFAAGAIDAAALATDAVTEIQSGLATASALATVDDFLDTEIAAIAADVTTLIGRLTALRAGYLDNLSAGAVAQASALATVAGYIDTEISDIQARLPATLDGGLMRAQVKGMDAGTVTAAAVATGAIDADALATDAVTEIAAGIAVPSAVDVATEVWDEVRGVTVYEAATNAVEASVIEAAVSAVGASTITIVSGLGDDIVNGQVIQYQGQVRRITDYVSATGVATVSPAWSPSITTGDEARVYPWAPNVDVAAVESGAVASIQSGLATAAALATAQTDLTRLLGLNNENVRIDNTTYTSGKCTAMRIRTFASAAAANASTSGAANGADSEVARYAVTASYTGDELDTYKMVREL